MVRNNFSLNLKYKRQLIYASGMLMAFLVFFAVIYYFYAESPEREPLNINTQTSKSWHKIQSSPPEMITIPDLPVFPNKIDTVNQSNAEPKMPNVAFNKAQPKNVNEQPVEHSAQTLFAENLPKGIVSHQNSTALKTMNPTVTVSALPRWKKYAVAARTVGNKPMIAIVIDDMGVDRRRSAMTIGLRAPLTLSFLTYAKDLKAQTDKARQMGHELLLHVSMEPRSTEVDPGPNALLIDLGEAEIRRRLNWGLSRFSTYVGLNNHMGSKFTADRKAMRIVMEEIKRRGLLFLDSRTSGKTIGVTLAKEMGVPAVERNIFLDHENSVSAVEAKLAQVETLARRMGAVIAIGHPRDVTIEALQTWLESIDSKGFQLVPLTTIVKKFGYF